MTTVAHSFRHGTHEFFRWWSGELRALLPAALRTAFEQSLRLIVIEPRAAELLVHRCEGGTSVPVARIPIPEGDGAIERERLRACLAQFDRLRWQLGVLLDDDEVLRDTLRLPSAAAENLREAIGFQLEKCTPFKRDEVHYDCRVTGTAGSEMLVDIAVTRRDIIERAQERFAGLGLPLRFLGTSCCLSGDDAALNLLPYEERRAAWHGTRLNRVLAVLAIILTGLAVWLPIKRDERYATALASQLQSRRAQAEVVMRLQKELEETIRRQGFVAQAKSATPSVLHLLNELTRRMPDNSWVSRITFAEGVVRADVHAPESTEIVQSIENSGTFSSARLIGAVRNNSGDGLERFSLEFSVLHSSGAGTPAGRDSK